MAKSSMLDGPVDIEDLEQDGVDLVNFFFQILTEVAEKLKFKNSSALILFS